MSTTAISGNTNTYMPAAKTQNASSTAQSPADANAADTLSSTFMTLLTQELQNQDPTAPMDSTAMVGQMISLNQLSQLTSMNQTLTGMANGASSAAPGTTTNS